MPRARTLKSLKSPVQEIREALGFSQQIFADALSVKQQTVSQYEKTFGDPARRKPGKKVVKRIIKLSKEQGLKLDFFTVFKLLDLEEIYHLIQ